MIQALYAHMNNKRKKKRKKNHTKKNKENLTELQHLEGCYQA
jgi:hypothetical protein